MDPQLRTFTVREANQVIPAISKLLLELKEKQERVLKLETEIDVLELVSSQGNEQSTQELNRLIGVHHEHVTEFYAIVDQIHQHGCLLKDVEAGLVDFYSVFDGKVVYLCWKLGEEKVAHWHEVGEGYAYRKPIDARQNQGKDVEDQV